MGADRKSDEHLRRPDELIKLAMLHEKLGRADEAIRLYEDGIRHAPCLEFYVNVGALYISADRADMAVGPLKTAVRLAPECVVARINLGMANLAIGRHAEALGCFRMAYELEPNNPEAIARLADLLEKVGRADEALALLQQAPSEARTHVTLLQLGNLWLAAGKTQEAADAFEQAIARRSDFAEAHFNAANAYADLNDFDLAGKSFARAAELRPDKPLWRLRADGCGPVVFRNGAEIEAYCRELERSLESLHSSGLGGQKPDRLPTLRAKPRDELRDDATSLDEIVATGAIPGFALSYHAMNYRRLKQRFADLYAPQFSHLAPARGMARSHPPRIGILITRRHEGVFLRCMSGIIDRLDRKRFEIVVLCSRPRMGRVQAGLSCTGLRFVPFDDVFTRAVPQVRAAACDLIYYWEVGSDPLNYFLPFARLAPIQCTSHGSLTTTGVPTIDYFYTSSLVEPDGSSEHYSERLWISKTLLMYKDRLAALKQLPRAHWGLRDDRHIYACLQNPVKLHPDFDALLAGILSADPRATIVLLSDPHGNAASALRRRFANSIAGATDGIVFVPRQNFPDYCALLQSADVLLDPMHFGAGSSCYDVFSFNLPMVTMPTEMMPGRVAFAFYRKMQFEELVATSHDDYICKAVRVATDRDYRQYVTERIAATSDVLFNDLEAVREHERFFEEAISGGNAAENR